MSNTPDRLTDDVVTQFLRTRSADPGLGLLDDIVRTVGATPQDRPWLGLRPILLPRRTHVIIAIALLLATMGAIAVGSRFLQPEPLPVERMTVIRQVIDAVNHRDLGSLRPSFTADGILEFPAIDARSGREGNVDMSDWSLDIENFPEDWVGSLDKWGMEARLGSCRTESESTVSCAVRTRWQVLQVEIGEDWTFDFDGARVRRLQMVRVDPDPSNRVLPLGLADLEGWEAWLRETHPEQVDHLLPTGPDTFGHWYFRFGLDASPDEIGASIREYVRAGLLGRDPVSDERMTVVRQHVDAINDRDAGGFTDAFLAEGVFGPGGNFRQSSSLFGNSLPLADADLVEAWMAINDAWDFEAEIIACNQDPEAPIGHGYGAGQGDPMVVNCEVAARWHSLSMEINELWSYEFHGSGLGHWEFGLLDLNPRERTLPHGYDGLMTWEAWLATTDPESAARYLNPRISEPPDCDGCAEWWESRAPGDPERAARLAPLLWSAGNDWSIQGHNFAPFGLIPYDPAFAGEIEASIQDYLAEGQS